MKNCLLKQPAHTSRLMPHYECESRLLGAPDSGGGVVPVMEDEDAQVERGGSATDAISAREPPMPPTHPAASRATTMSFRCWEVSSGSRPWSKQLRFCSIRGS